MGLKIWVMDKKFEFFIENWEHMSIFLELLTKMDTTLKIHNLCNLKLHYFFKVWCQLGTHIIDIQIAIYIQYKLKKSYTLEIFETWSKINNITCFIRKLWLYKNLIKTTY